MRRNSINFKDLIEKPDRVYISSKIMEAFEREKQIDIEKIQKI